MDCKKLIEKLQSINDLSVIPNEPMKNHTSFRVGGMVDVLIIPNDIEAVRKAVQYVNEAEVPLYIMGNGSNLLISDKGISGVVLKLGGGLNKMRCKEDTIYVQSGVLLSRLSKYALKHELCGLEFAEGIPGTVGGAVAMNAGAYGGEIKDVLINSTCLGKNGDILHLTLEEHTFGYRRSKIADEGYVVLESAFQLKKGCKEEILGAMRDFSSRRKQKQPLEFPSAGSTFKRPEGNFAGKLIQDSGLAGYRVGGAEVSVKHCGFVINTGEATASDILAVIAHVKETVYKNYRINLELEVKLLGE